MSNLTALERDPFPAEQFADAAQQSHTATLGMWTFLATEVLFFGVLFLSFFTYRLRWPVAFAQGATELKWYLGTINTAVLLGSSFTMALAVHAARRGDAPAIVRRVIYTIVIGAVFLAIKFTEYGIEYKDRLVPSVNYSDVAPDGTMRQEYVLQFMTFYFLMTGFHALHMVIGLAVLSVIAWLAHRRRFSAEYHNPVEVCGLYWHFVDMVWVFLFPTLYLLRHP